MADRKWPVEYLSLKAKRSCSYAREVSNKWPFGEWQCLTVQLPFPPSVNHYWRHAVIHGSPRVLISRRGRKYREQVLAAIDRHNPLRGDLAVDVDVWMPDRRKRDLDNVLKALLDACTHARVWEDDSQIRRLSVANRGLRRPDGLATVRAERLNPCPPGPDLR